MVVQDLAGHDFAYADLRGVQLGGCQLQVYPEVRRALYWPAQERDWCAGLLDKDLGAQYINCEFRQDQSL